MKLTSKKRKALPDSDFAVIENKDGKKIRRFPINDKAHARNALARMPQAKGLSSKEKAKIENKAQKKLYGTSNDKKVEEVKKKRKSMSDMSVSEYRAYMKKKGS